MAGATKPAAVSSAKHGGGSTTHFRTRIVPTGRTNAGDGKRPGATSIENNQEKIGVAPEVT